MTTEAPYSFREPDGLLAHYTTAAAVFEHILPERRLRMSPYHKMRDPAENQDRIPAITWRGDLRQPDAESAWASVYDQIKSVRDAMRVLSFTRDAVDRRASWPGFDCCWARPRMWEQYGDDHCGACALFDRDRFERTLRAKLGADRLYLNAVDYTREGIAASPTRTVTDARIFDPQQRDLAVAEFIDRYRGDFFFLKSDDFETEAEYRAVLKMGDLPSGAYDTEDEGYAYVGYGDSLVAVVLGLHFPDWQRPGAREMCATADVKMLRMNWDGARPRLRGVGGWLR